MNIKEHWVPNYTKGHERPVKFGVIHYVSCKYYTPYENNPYSIDGILKLFDDLGSKYKFSAHYIISREGEIYQLVRLEDTSWNAGKSVIAIPEYTEYLNDCSVGVELVGMCGDKYTTKQYQALAKLSNYIEDEVDKNSYGHIEHWVGHDWISGKIAVKLGIKEKSKIKKDPGILFDWDIFLREKYRLRLDTELRASAKPDFKKEILKEMGISELTSLFISKIFKKKK